MPVIIIILAFVSLHHLSRCRFYFYTYFGAAASPLSMRSLQSKDKDRIVNAVREGRASTARLFIEPIGGFGSTSSPQLSDADSMSGGGGDAGPVQYRSLDPRSTAELIKAAEAVGVATALDSDPRVFALSVEKMYSASALMASIVLAQRHEGEHASGDSGASLSSTLHGDVALSLRRREWRIIKMDASVSGSIVLVSVLRSVSCLFVANHDVSHTSRYLRMFS